MRSRIMVVSRDAAVRARLAQLLTRGGYRAEVAEGTAEARRAGLDGVALAILAPDGLGGENAAAEELRAAVGRTLIVAPPGAGAANPDCIDSSDEARLLARVAEALVDRPEPEAAEPTLEFAGYRLDLAGRCLKNAAGKEIPLRAGEFSLLRAFVQRAGRVLSRDQLLQLTAGRDAEAYDRSVDMQVARLRRKIEPDPRRPSIIVTVPGAGYKFAAEVHEAKLPSRPEPSPQTPPTRSDTAPRAPERRHITALAAELGPGEGGRLPSDPEDLSAMVGAFRRYASVVLTQHGGVIGESHGREILAYFGYPMAQENDAERAVRAALAIQRALTRHNVDNAATDAPELAARIGLDCGLVVVDSTGDVFGDAPNVAARVLSAAEPGTVLVTTNVLRQVSGLFVTEERREGELIGMFEPVNLFRVVRASGGRRRAAGRALTRFVGREEELGVLARRWERARGGNGQLVLIIGEPGIGKSRLVEEFRAKLAETSHTWVEWSALQLLQNTPLHPITEWGRMRFGVEAPAEQRLADLENTLGLVGLDPTEYAPLLAPIVDIPLPAGRAANMPPEELRRRQLEAIVAWSVAGAHSQPVALVFEDLQWADPTSIDLMQALAKRGAQAPLLVVATARPEFRPAWSLRAHHSVISLHPLDRAGVAQMLGEFASRHALSRDVVEGVSERTGGVPLYVEEVARLLLERGEAGGLQAIPQTLQQSLAARLDRLGEAREVAQIGAVLGRDFSYALLRALAHAVGEIGEPSVHRAPVTAVDDRGLQSALDRLVDADLLFVHGAGTPATYRFRHALIQDAAYDSLLKSRRQTLHRRAGEILREEPESASVAPEAVAHHFTEAGLDDVAIEWWGKAGDQALRRSAFQEAIPHLGKAIAMADRKEGTLRHGTRQESVGNQHSRWRSDYAIAVMSAKGFAAEETRAALAGVGESRANVAEKYPIYYARFARSYMRGELRQARKLAETFLREAEAYEHGTEAAVARRILGSTCLLQGELMEARALLERTLADYTESLDAEARIHFGHDARPIAAANLASATWLLGDVENARRLADLAVRRAAELGHAPTNTNAHSYLAMFEVRRNDCAAALRLAEEILFDARKHKMDLWVAFGEVFAAWARGRCHDSRVGAAALRLALANYLNQGNKLFAPLFHGMLADLEAETNNLDAAVALTDEGLRFSEETGERFSDPYLHRLRGYILSKRDPANPEPAEEAFRAAVAVAQAQKARSFELQAALSLAKLYQSIARPVDAHAVLGPALDGFSPTPEMPEIAVALSLMERLASGRSGR